MWTLVTTLSGAGQPVLDRVEMGRFGMQTAPASTMRRAQTRWRSDRATNKKVYRTKVTSSRGGWPGDETESADDAEPGCSPVHAVELPDLAQRLDRRSSSCKNCRPEGDDYVTRFETARAPRIGLFADGLSEE